MSTHGAIFRVALTADFYDADGTCKFSDMGLSVFDDHAHIRTSVFRGHRPEIGPDQVENVQGVFVLTPAVTAETVSASEKPAGHRPFRRGVRLGRRGRMH